MSKHPSEKHFFYVRKISFSNRQTCFISVNNRIWVPIWQLIKLIRAKAHLRGTDADRDNVGVNWDERLKGDECGRKLLFYFMRVQSRVETSSVKNQRNFSVENRKRGDLKFGCCDYQHIFRLLIKTMSCRPGLLRANKCWIITHGRFTQVEIHICTCPKVKKCHPVACTPLYSYGPVFKKGRVWWPDQGFTWLACAGVLQTSGVFDWVYGHTLLLICVCFLMFSFIFFKCPCAAVTL